MAWIRTSIGIMGFGFVVVKFSLFIRQITAVLGAPALTPKPGYSHIIGIILVALGGITIAYAYVRYNQTRNQLNNEIYHHSTTFLKIVTVLIIVVCIALLVYLLMTN